MKKQVLYSLLFTVLSFVACGGSSDSSGGAGADFDSSLYYTKTEVDEKFTALANEYCTQETADAKIFFYTGNPSDISSTGFSNAIQVSFTGDFEDTAGALISITNHSDENNIVFYGHSVSSWNSIEVPAGATSILALPTGSDPEDINFWAGALNKTSTVSPYIRVMPVIYFR